MDYAINCREFNCDLLRNFTTHWLLYADIVNFEFHLIILKIEWEWNAHPMKCHIDDASFASPDVTARCVIWCDE